MRHDRVSAQQGSLPGRPAGRSEARASNFFHPVANAPSMSRRALRAEHRQHRRANRRARALTVAVVLITALGLIALVVMTHVLRSPH
jgi:hypothetical protein